MRYSGDKSDAAAALTLISSHSLPVFLLHPFLEAFLIPLSLLPDFITTKKGVGLRGALRRDWKRSPV